MGECWKTTSFGESLAIFFAVVCFALSAGKCLEVSITGCLVVVSTGECLVLSVLVCAKTGTKNSRYKEVKSSLFSMAFDHRYAAKNSKMKINTITML